MKTNDDLYDQKATSCGGELGSQTRANCENELMNAWKAKDDQCHRDFDNLYRESFKPIWLGDVAVAFIPIPFFWLIAFLAYRIISWVNKGFTDK